MKIINIEQGTPEWKKFRREHIGASDVSIIMGINPFRSIHDLWAEKTKRNGYAEEKESQDMTNGKEYEKIARFKYCEDSGIVFSNLVGESDTISYLEASFDGIDMDYETLLEIKSLKDSSYQKNLEIDIPDHYYLQMQTQLMVAEKAKKCIYLVYNIETDKYFTKEVFPDKKVQEEIIQYCNEFWEMVDKFLAFQKKKKKFLEK